MKSLQSAKKAIEEAQKQAKQVMEQAFQDVSKELFDQHPTLKAFRWNQYTPYFNDGDECVFDARTTYPDLRFTDTDEEAGEMGDGFLGEYDLTGDQEKTFKAVVEFLRQFDNDDYKNMFGDHCQVTVERGKKIEVDQYDHD